MKRMSFLVVFAAVLLLGGFGCALKSQKPEGTTDIDRNQILADARATGLIMNEKEIEQMNDPSNRVEAVVTIPANATARLTAQTEGMKSAALADVTGGGSFGLAFLDENAGNTTVIAKMGNFPVVGEDEVYEGWIVRRGESMGVISLGRIEKSGDQFVLVSTIQQPPADFTFFVVTRNGDHLLEGSFK